MTYDVAVIGAGILGLAHAYQFAKRGLRVVVLERHLKAQGASIRNFGMIWPMGQPQGSRYELALRSRQIWEEVLQAAELWYAPCGSLHVAYHPDETQVLREFYEQTRDQRPSEWLTSDDVTTRFPAVRAEGLQAGFFSPTEMTVDPRQVIALLPRWLEEALGVNFEFGAKVLRLEGDTLVTTNGPRRAKRTVICTGADFRDLCPTEFAAAGLVPCKLQMMRTQPYHDHFHVGTMLAAGLTLRHYASFAACPSLPALIQRTNTEYPEHVKFGIHVMVSQNGLGELVLGDSHEYGSAIEPFDQTHIDQLILQYLGTFFAAPAMQVVARWHGIYVKHPREPFVTARPNAQTLAVTGVGGAGMTLSFGLAEQLVREWLGESV